MLPLQVIPVPCLTDNYAYLVHAAGSNEALLIDACEAAPILRELEQRSLVLRAILSTHHHHDHVGGNVELCERCGVSVYGHRSERARIPKFEVALDDGDCFQVAGLDVRVHHVPAHTRGALAYRIGEACFTGDTLFSGGAGRLFEGTAEELFHALFQVFGRMGEGTIFYTGHEYTLKNLSFARTVDPGNVALEDRYRDVSARRAKGQYTASSTWALERATNPFLRVDRPEIAQGLGLDPDSPPAWVLAKLRAARDDF